MMTSAGWSLLASSDNNMSVQGTISAAERSIRSVFVGNIPYEATEEQLKDIFSEVGPVVSFRLVYDRETGKPKGYGFCEYKDQETALSAMRNLNGYELNGRSLRVDNAASEKNKEELKNLQAALGGPPQESPYGAECDPDKAPEAISKAVASLPPEQMFELMKQMKLCIQNNPNEARNMLLQNPQLAYALLQAQVVMRIVDPQVAMNMLHRSNVNTTISEAASLPVSAAPVISQPMNTVNPNPVGEPAYPPGIGNVRGGVRPSLLGDRPPVVLDPPRPAPPPAVTTAYSDALGTTRDFDMRDPRSMGDRDMRSMSSIPGMPQGGMPRDPRVDNREIREPRDPRVQTAGEAERAAFDPRFRGDSHPSVGDNRTAMYDGRPPPSFDQRNASPYDQRSPLYEQRDPRLQPTTHPPPVSVPQQATMRPQMPNINRAAPSLPVTTTTAAPPTAASRAPAPPASQSQISPQDQEKAALIMQVLQLSEQQIAMLPPEQRQSIMVLKDQIARSTQPQ